MINLSTKEPEEPTKAEQSINEIRKEEPTVDDVMQSMNRTWSSSLNLSQEATVSDSSCRRDSRLPTLEQRSNSLKLADDYKYLDKSVRMLLFRSSGFGSLLSGQFGSGSEKDPDLVMVPLRIRPNFVRKKSYFYAKHFILTVYLYPVKNLNQNFKHKPVGTYVFMENVKL